MAVAVVALVFIAPDFRNALTSATLTVLVDIRDDVFQASYWEGIKVSAGLAILVFTLIISLALSLYLPFTERNLDVFVFFVVFAHVILVCTSNFLVFEARHDPISGIFAAASLLYFFLLSIGLRFRLMTISTTKKQASSTQAIFAALSVIVLVAVLSIGFNLHWANCYAIAAAYAVGVAQLIERVFVSTRL